nr:alcohol dehydrogenase catalytic domain-containing protein [Paramesorhizobium deserti]
MIAVRVRAPHSLEVIEVDRSEPGPNEVRVIVSTAGICGSDIHILHGSNPFAKYPRVIGHEFAGTVAAVGSAVTSVAIGDHVVVDPVISCGHCYACSIGRSNVCANLEVMGVHRDGGFGSEVVVPAENAVKVSKDLPIAVAALAEPFSIAANVLSRAGCDERDTVLVYGSGTVGLTVLQVAKLKGARVIVADPDKRRLERAEQFGADRLLQTGKDEYQQAWRPKMTGSDRHWSSTAPGFQPFSKRPAAWQAPPDGSAFLDFRRPPAMFHSRRSSRRN